MFRGINRINLDAKGRLAIPTRYRERLQEYCASELVVTVDPDRCLLIYPLPDWNEIEQRLMKLPTFDESARILQRLLVGHATEVEMDGQGRVLLPTPLREFARLEKQTVMIGQGARFELWDEVRWTAKQEAWLEKVDLEQLKSPELGTLVI
ncbi:MAG: division/cell wall cluster transcriptional repressor MraZ [Gammaproteobacteria bacterium]|nr:division/cell wall cluster transcriptional repressor MraZ [Gammaproteobacteria bacterium]MCP5406468.1 division/cell wall cluster transcriptional repressor MraZ [Chromatiaceae bacterium]MCP5408136.1 division/cell wall cluster transcriptional repressor MraZ [Chromatiaceae bacterium]MCP5443035.1 division/cell wall cluster transcriptional repressor MraZ [Chromatiaceae bacterium]